MFLAEDGRPLALDWRYTRHELMADGAVHLVGVFLGLVGAIVIVAISASNDLGWIEQTSLALYAASLVGMLAVSATYNMWPVCPRKWSLRRFDHALIYLMIAGTYTPLVALAGHGALAWSLLAFVWIVASIGITVKILMPGRWDRLSIGLYLVLGWVGVLAYESVIAWLSPAALWLLLVGGVLYSIGVVFHLWHSLPYQNAIWHGFVLVATGCCYGSILTSALAAVG